MMDRRQLLAASALAAMPLPALARPSETAFPGAMGWAATTVGGRGGRVVRVTTLAAEGSGSLREALEAEGPRIVVFEVGGIIDLGRRDIRLQNPFVTIAGQTAPEPGITIIRGGISIRAHDVIVRHIRIRPGADGAGPKSGWEVDGLTTSGAHDVIVDQCSFSWATDENLSASGPRFDGGDAVTDWRKHTSRRITLSRNIVAEGLSNSSHAKGEHSKGTLIHDNATEVLIVGNLYAHNYERNQLFKGGVHAVAANNLIYNPGNRCMHYALNASEWVGHPWEVGQLAIVGNVTKGGRSTRADLPFLIVEGQGDLDLYAADNPAAHADGRPMQEIGVISDRQPVIRRLERPSHWPQGFRARPAAAVEAWVMAEAGARPWARDAVDARIVQDFHEGTGRVIDDEGEVGGYPAAASSTRGFVESDWDLATMTRKDGRPS